MRLQTTFEAHDSYVLDLRFTSDGTSLISAGMDNAIKCWTTDDWSLLRTFSGHDHSANSIDLSPDEQLLASGSSDNSVRIWSFTDGQLLHTLQDRKQTVASVRFSPNGRWIGAASYGGRIAIWRTTGESVAGIRISKKHVTSLAFHPDGRRLAVSGLDDEITVLSLPDGEVLARLGGHSTAVWSLRFLNGGNTLLSMGYEKSIRLWDTAAWLQKREIVLEGEDVRGVTVAPDEGMAAVNQKGAVQLWRLPEWSLAEIITIDAKVISSVAFSPDGNVLAVGGADRKIRVYDNIR